MGLRKNKSLLDQATDTVTQYAEQAKPHLESAVATAKEKAGPALADARSKAAPVVAAGATQDVATKQQAYATIQAEIARDLPYIPVVLNASQSFFNTEKFSGWPSEDDLYAMPLPYVSVANAVVLTHLTPAK